MRVDLDGSTPEGEITGPATGSGIGNVPTVPYTDTYADHARRAMEALSRPEIPSDARDLVRDYFREIEP